MTKLYHEPMVHVTRAIAAQGRVMAWLARRADISPGHLTRVLSGERRLQPQVARVIADSLGLPMEYVTPMPMPEREEVAV